MRETKQVLFNADTLNQARGANIAQTTARQSFKAYTTSTFNAFSQIFFLLCSKTIIAAILIHKNAIDLNLTAISKFPYLLCLFRLADFIFADFITSSSSTENNNAFTTTSATKNICRQKTAAYLAAYKDVSPLKISAFY
ncbi:MULTISPECIES: hypothetical protein [unclassified Bartonella]|uniref:hypothetical protein n=1 Tax=unclassified Bartonella TaxID=2645622 RepID=UPI0035CEF439